MSTTPWDILGIGDDADAKAIKRAYARALKSTRPDEDPIGFQRLNDAYEGVGRRPTSRRECNTANGCG